MARRGLLIVLSSPSGAGKTTLTRRLRAWDTTLQFSVSSTTRAPREGEIDGTEILLCKTMSYRFLSYRPPSPNYAAV